jgi:hypothetical protein
VNIPLLIAVNPVAIISVFNESDQVRARHYVIGAAVLLGHFESSLCQPSYPPGNADSAKIRLWKVLANFFIVLLGHK